MSHQNEIQNHFGYLCTQPPYENAPGGAQLHVYVRKNPTGQHYDPVKLQMTIKDEAGKGVTTLVVEYPWPGKARYQAIAGRLTLTDHIGKEVTLFTFGGTLNVEPQEQLVHCALISPVSILNWQNGNELPAKLAAEAEIVLAERQAFYAATDEGLFGYKLAAADPKILYAAILQTLLQKLSKFREIELQALELHDLHRFLQDELARLHKLSGWPEHVPALEDFL